ncbi:MAG: hypothetical protein FWG55_06515 [Candidatus Bathyarchaeota archaeon]|nr:hypothetical protein [Candidatus Termiticorpusculum sp.]
MTANQKELINELKLEWTKLWRERHDDKVRAEGIAVTDYSHLFVDKGTIIHATRTYKALNFKEILEQHNVVNAERYVPADRFVGGWNKFVKCNIVNKNASTRRREYLADEKKVRQQPKKGGRGWLHAP